MAIEGRSIKLPFPYPDLATEQWDSYALLANLRFLTSKLTAIQQGQLVPSGSLQFFRSGSTCPDGYTKVDDASLGNRYLRLSVSTAGGTGGTSLAAITTSGLHTHATGVPSSVVTVNGSTAGVTVSVSRATHIHTITLSGGHTHSVSVNPRFLDVILCEKD